MFISQLYFVTVIIQVLNVIYKSSGPFVGYFIKHFIVNSLVNY